MVSKALYSSNKDDWGTPDYIFNALHKEFNIDCDVCSNGNAKLPNTISKEMNALEVNWLDYGKVFFMNPPYGRKTTPLFIKKAYQESLKGATVVMLVAARTSNAWFHDYILDKAEVRFIRGRVKFLINGEPAANSAPFPSMLCIFRPR